jgi:16S rRNA (cytidine1402-2'-O)-methyltransferase
MTISLPQDSRAVLETALYVVATPIGHLDDLSLRAISVLRSVSFVACEDTRTSKPLLQHIGSSAQTFSVHQHNERQAAAHIVELLSQGKAVALISDAGTPGISDPGALAVAHAVQAGYKIIPIPGPTALATVLSASGLVSQQGVFFAGFMPQTPSKRRARLLELSRQEGLLVFYEAPHRISEFIDDLLTQFGPERQLVIGRELTKRFEQIVHLPLGQARAWLDQSSDHLRGEFVLALGEAPAAAQEQAAAPIELEALLTELVKELPAASSAKIAHKLLGVSRDAAYSLASALAEKHKPKPRRQTS